MLILMSYEVSSRGQWPARGQARFRVASLLLVFVEGTDFNTPVATFPPATGRSSLFDPVQVVRGWPAAILKQLLTLTGVYGESGTGEGFQVEALDVAHGPVCCTNRLRRNGQGVESSIRTFTPLQINIDLVADDDLRNYCSPLWTDVLAEQ